MLRCVFVRFDVQSRPVISDAVSQNLGVSRIFPDLVHLAQISHFILGLELVHDLVPLHVWSDLVFLEIGHPNEVFLDRQNLGFSEYWLQKE